MTNDQFDNPPRSLGGMLGGQIREPLDPNWKPPTEDGKMRKLLIWAACIVGVVAVSLYIWDSTTTAGRDVMFDIAVKNGLCLDTACVAGMDKIRDVYAREFNVPGSRADWCLGVEQWASVKVYRGGLLKSFAIYFMGLPCGWEDAKAGITHTGK